MSGRAGAFSRQLVDAEDFVLAETRTEVDQRRVDYVECSTEGCWRPEYLDGRCKRCHDQANYANRRHRDHALARGRYVWVRTRDGRWQAGVAKSRAEARDPRQPWALEVLVAVEDWNAPEWWPVDQVELRELGEEAVA